MPISYINKLLSREEFVSKSYMKGKSKGFENFTNSMLRDIDRFSDHTYHKKTEDIVIDLKKDMDKSNNPGYALKFFQDYIDWLDTDHPDILIIRNTHQKKGRPIKKKTPLAIHNYVSRARKFQKMCGGIRIDDGDYTDYLTFPADENDEEAEPLSKSEIKLKPKKIISHVKSELKAIIRGHVRDTDIAKLAEPDFDKVYDWLEYLTPKDSSKLAI